MSDSPGLRGLNAPSGADNGLRGLNAPSGADNGLRGLNAPSGADNGLRGLNAPSGADITVTPAPTEAEVAAIMAAYEALWPKPPAPDATKGAPAQWRFSGRWWNKPVLRSPHG